MTSAERDRLRLELRVGRILGRSMVGKLRPLDDPTTDDIPSDRMIRRYFPNALISFSGQPSDLERTLQRMPDDGYSTTYDEYGNVLSRIRYR